MVLASLTPSAKAIIASLIIGIKIRFAIKPGKSFTTQGILPNCSVKDTIILVTEGSVSLLLITSTNFITGTGFIKCIPITWVGLCVAAASSLIEMLDVFVANMQLGFAYVSMAANIFFLTTLFSVAASIIKSASPIPVFKSV